MILKVNNPLYVITDDHMPFPLLKERLKSCLEAGIGLVQYRNKLADTGVLYKEALEIKELCDAYNVPLIINDRLDIALAVDAHGLHVGQSDLPPAIARKLLGEEKYLGVSVHNDSEAKKALEDGADHVGVGALFTTQTKADANSVTLDTLQGIKTVLGKDIPIFGIGGITPERLTSAYTPVIDGIAVISAVLHHEKPEEIINKFKTILNS